MRDPLPEAARRPRVAGPGRIAILAFGNEFRGDDGIGPEIARRLRQRSPARVSIAQPQDALAILDAWQHTSLTIAVDAAVSGAPPGTVHRFDLGARPLRKDLARCSSHGLGLTEALELGQILGRMPARLILYAIEGARFAHGVPLSPEVETAGGDVACRVLAEIGRHARAGA